ncbi:uncharacterized protein METZ01_LOCUS326499, partial [marine metagenome]
TRVVRPDQQSGTQEDVRIGRGVAGWGIRRDSRPHGGQCTNRGHDQGPGAPRPSGGIASLHNVDEEQTHQEAL